MYLSQKSLNFARKILKYNPKNTIHQNHQSCSIHHHQNCQHTQKQSIKPYLHVHDHRKQREIYEKPTPQKLENMKSFKQQGNQHFKSQRYQQASYFYNKIIIYADYTFPQSEKQQKQMDELLQQAHCNLGITLVKLNQHKKSISNFTQASNGPSPKLVKKSLYWLVKCTVNQGQFDKAKQYLQKYKALTQQDKDNQLQDLQKQIKKSQDSYNSKSKNVFGQVFSKPSG